MTGVIMDEDKLKPRDVVLIFQDCLKEAGNPIVFTEESGLPAQRAHAKRLIAACKCSRREIKAVIQAYCADPWWVENQPTLHQVVKRLDVLRSSLKGRGQYAQTWKEL